MVVEDSMLNNIHDRGLSKQRTAKVKDFPGASTEMILEKLENLLDSRPDALIADAGTNDLPKNLNPLNNIRKVHWKCPELSTETKLVFY